ncbi:MAG: hypothetical protein TQ37_07600 [Candidatus Synechococcus spongiarum 15L]|uniref:Uncharacterized protein n=1 Tax=Candidatus Synechococcus spongiarum 15L TaxID=1608419 RepID=A0A0G8ATV4_9SYNE|nr:MAG: hypothetical protein TQ37_07600 [Candidatus Synechococcus spongiarum 15L]
MSSGNRVPDNGDGAARSARDVGKDDLSILVPAREPVGLLWLRTAPSSSPLELGADFGSAATPASGSAPANKVLTSK